MIILEPYNPSWAQLFEHEKMLLLAACQNWKISIEHIGSTAIPGIKAKPVIDIMLGVADLCLADLHLVAIIQSLGYCYLKQYEETMPKRRYFQKNESTVRTHQIHLVQHGCEFWERHLLFRDYLRLHPRVAQEYEALKIKLASQFSDTNQYAAAKTEFIRNIEQLARLVHSCQLL
jgi:GrpB-like predicted nucleotidyltransferase (UPF0157 family)